MKRSFLNGSVATLAIGCTLFMAACGEEDDLDQDLTQFEAGAQPGPQPDASLPGFEAGVWPDAGGFGGLDASGGTLPDASADVDAGPDAPDGGQVVVDAGGADSGGGTPGACCADGDCLCHGPAPTRLTSARGPYKTANYTIAGTGCVFYPTDAEPPFAAVTVSDGFTGTGGCNSIQTGQWGPLYASWGIVAMIVDTGAGDQPNVRGRALAEGIAAFKTENTKNGSPLFGKLAGRYGSSGFSMGGGGTSYTSRDDKSLLTSIAIMPWGPVTSGVTTPTLVICGASDGTAPCSSHGNRLYTGIANSVPKMRVQVSAGHAGQPGTAGGKSGEYGLAFQKVFLEGDERWRPFLVAAPSQETTIK